MNPTQDSRNAMFKRSHGKQAIQQRSLQARICDAFGLTCAQINPRHIGVVQTNADLAYRQKEQKSERGLAWYNRGYSNKLSGPWRALQAMVMQRPSPEANFAIIIRVLTYKNSCSEILAASSHPLLPGATAFSK